MSYVFALTQYAFRTISFFTAFSLRFIIHYSRKHGKTLGNATRRSANAWCCSPFYSTWRMGLWSISTCYIAHERWYCVVFQLLFPCLLQIRWVLPMVGRPWLAFLLRKAFGFTEMVVLQNPKCQNIGFSAWCSIRSQAASAKKVKENDNYKLVIRLHVSFSQLQQRSKSLQ